MALIARVMFAAFGHVPGDWTQILGLLAVLSMFWGSIGGIGQTNIKRLMAYSSIAHMGFALLGLAAGTTLGVQSMLLYMTIYTVMNVGTFAFILSMQRDGVPVTDLMSLNQFARENPLKAMAVLILMFSLAGVPPMLGFFAKFGVLAAAVAAGKTWLAVLGVIASVIGAFYYLRIVYYMYFGEAGEGVESKMGTAQYAGLIGAAALTVIGSFSMMGVEGAAQRAAESLTSVAGVDPSVGAIAAPAQTAALD